MRCASNETLQRVPHVLPESCETHGWIVLRGKLYLFLARSIDGKTVSNKQILSVVNDFKSIGDNSRTAAEVFEVIARNQLATGINRINTGLMKYSRVVEGQYNAIHGIDGIGVALDGRPVLMEFTIDGSKNLAKTEQLSGAWCAKKWNLLIDANPGLKDELIEAGMKPEHWRKITADEALKMAA